MDKKQNKSAVNPSHTRHTSFINGHCRTFILYEIFWNHSKNSAHVSVLGYVAIYSIHCCLHFASA